MGFGVALQPDGDPDLLCGVAAGDLRRGPSGHRCPRGDLSLPAADLLHASGARADPALRHLLWRAIRQFDRLHPAQHPRNAVRRGDLPGRLSVVPEAGAAGQALFVTSRCASSSAAAFAIILLIAFAPPLAASRSPSARRNISRPCLSGCAASIASVPARLPRVSPWPARARTGHGRHRRTRPASTVHAGHARNGRTRSTLLPLPWPLRYRGSPDQSSPRAVRRRQPAPRPPPAARCLPIRQEAKDSVRPAVRGSLIGLAVAPCRARVRRSPPSSPMPSKRAPRRSERFGTGIFEGVAAPEADNNASVQAALIPDPCIGIPGDAVMAFMLGATIIHGIVPGAAADLPSSRNCSGAWSQASGSAILLLLLITLPLIGFWVRILSIPRQVSLSDDPVPDLRRRLQRQQQRLRRLRGGRLRSPRLRHELAALSGRSGAARLHPRATLIEENFPGGPCSSPMAT